MASVTHGGTDWGGQEREFQVGSGLGGNSNALTINKS